MTLSKKEHFYAPRECLLGLWQTDNRSEHIVPMVRTAEEVVLGSPRGGIEIGIACCGGVPCQTRANVYRGVINGNTRLASIFEHRPNLGGVRPLAEIDDFSIPKREEIEDVKFFRASVLRERHIRAPMQRRFLPPQRQTKLPASR
jgi:hypothetical protein